MTRTAPRVAQALVLVVAFFAGAARAEITLAEKGRSKLTFSLDVTAATFLQDGSWFGESRSFLGDETDSWLELGVEPGFAFELPGGKGTWFGALSALATGTAGDDPSGATIGVDPTYRLDIEQAHVGWRIEDAFDGAEDDSFSVSVGHQDFSIGTGLLIADGGADGGRSGAWYLALREAFRDSILVTYSSQALRLEAFRLANHPPAGGPRGSLVGANVEGTIREQVTLGLTFAVVNDGVAGTDELDAWSARIDRVPESGFVFRGELALQRSREISADGWFAQVGWAAGEAPWTPTLTYRFARFDGDDPLTAKDESFRELAYGYTDYGSWYQGEITGNYALGNGNTETHQLRVEATPAEGVTVNAIYYAFKILEPESLAPGLAKDDWGDEIDLTVDWEATERLTVTGVLGALFPGDAAEQAVGGDATWISALGVVAFSW